MMRRYGDLPPRSTPAAAGGDVADHELAKVLRQVCEIAGRRLLYRDEQAIVDRALELANQVLAGERGRDGIGEVRNWCERHGHRVYAGDVVQTAAAAAILGVTAGHLRNNRGGIPFHRSGRRCWYSLADLARHLASCSSAGPHERMKPSITSTRGRK